MDTKEMHNGNVVREGHQVAAQKHSEGHQVAALEGVTKWLPSYAEKRTGQVVPGEGH